MYLCMSYTQECTNSGNQVDQIILGNGAQSLGFFNMEPLEKDGEDQLDRSCEK